MIINSFNSLELDDITIIASDSDGWKSLEIIVNMELFIVSSNVDRG